MGEIPLGIEHLPKGGQDAIGTRPALVANEGRQDLLGA